MYLSKGGVVLFYYGFFSYIFPIILVFISNVDLDEFYDINEINFSSSFIVLTIYFASLISIGKQDGFNYKSQSLPLFFFSFILCLCQSILSLYYGINSLRYESNTFENYGILSAIFYLNIQINSLVIFHTIFLVDKSQKLKSKTLLISILTSVVSINGLASTLVCLAAILGFLNSYKYDKMLNSNVNFSNLFSIKKIYIFSVICAIMYILIFVGLTVKESRKSYDVTFTEISEYLNLDYFSVRLTPPIISLNYVSGKLYDNNMSSVVDSLETILCMNSLRINKVLNLNNTHNSCETFMRTNYLNIDKDKNLPGGTAPGLIASVLYLVPAFPLNLIALHLIIRFFIFIYNWLLLYSDNLNILGYVLVLKLSDFILASLPDELIIFDDSAIMLIMYICLALRIKLAKKQYHGLCS